MEFSVVEAQYQPMSLRNGRDNVFAVSFVELGRVTGKDVGDCIKKARSFSQAPILCSPNDLSLQQAPVRRR